MNPLTCMHTCTYKPSVCGMKPPQTRKRNDSLLYRYLATPLLLRSSDCELNPGSRTPKFPCQICEKACSWGQRVIACDSCKMYGHVQPHIWCNSETGSVVRVVFKTSQLPSLIISASNQVTAFMNWTTPWTQWTPA